MGVFFCLNDTRIGGVVIFKIHYILPVKGNLLQFVLRMPLNRGPMDWSTKEGRIYQSIFPKWGGMQANKWVV